MMTVCWAMLEHSSRLGPARNAIVILIWVALSGGCGSVGARPDAGGRDSAVELGNPCPRVSCGQQCCDSVARVCAPAACGCPDASIFPDPFHGDIQLIDPNQVPGALTAVALFSAPDGAAHTLVVGYRPDTPVGVSLPFVPPNSQAGSNTPFAGIGWRVNLTTQTALTGFYATAGSVILSRACTGGVAGTLSNLTFTEQTATRDQTPYPGGCSFTVASIAFDVGTSCP